MTEARESDNYTAAQRKVLRESVEPWLPNVQFVDVAYHISQTIDFYKYEEEQLARPGFRGRTAQRKKFKRLADAFENAADALLEELGDWGVTRATRLVHREDYYLFCEPGVNPDHSLDLEPVLRCLVKVARRRIDEAAAAPLPNPVRRFYIALILLWRWLGGPLSRTYSHETEREEGALVEFLEAAANPILGDKKLARSSLKSPIQWAQRNFSDDEIFSMTSEGPPGYALLTGTHLVAGKGHR